MAFLFQVKEGRGSGFPNRVLYFFKINYSACTLNECILAFLRTEIALML